MLPGAGASASHYISHMPKRYSALTPLTGATSPDLTRTAEKQAGTL